MSTTPTGAAAAAPLSETPATAAYGLSRRARTRDARARIVALIHNQAIEFTETLDHTLPALAAIRSRALDLSSTSARARALGLEVLPAPHYLSFRTGQLRAHLYRRRHNQAWHNAAQARVDELEMSLECAIDLSANPDLSGELHLPFELIAAMQTGARAGLTPLRRLRETLDNLYVGQLDSADSAAATPPTPRSAQWLLQVTNHVLPANARARYSEEFQSELHELATEGVGRRGQLAYALRLTTRSWALRAALPPDPSTAAPNRATVTATTRAHAATVPPAGLRLSDEPRNGISRWIVNHMRRWQAQHHVQIINEQWTNGHNTDSSRDPSAPS